MPDFPSDADDDLKRIETEIIALTEAAFENGRPYYLMSELGIALGDDLRNLKLLTRGTLADFIRRHLSKRYRIVPRGVHKNIYVLTPAGTEGTNLEERAAEGTTITIGAGQVKKQKVQHPRYHYRFWAAFSVPPSNDKRYLNTSNYTFEDIPADAQAPIGTLEIQFRPFPRTMQ